MKIYQPGDVTGDLALLNWYMTLNAEGSIATAFGPSMWPLSVFVKTLSDPCNRVFYLEDERGWWAVAWITPLGGAMTWGFWVREDVRGTKGPKHDEGFSLVMDSLRVTLTYVPLVLSMTKQAHAVKLLLGLGFTYLGHVPYLFDGDECDTFYLTREVFGPRYERWSEHGKHGQG